MTPEEEIQFLDKAAIGYMSSGLPGIGFTDDPKRVAENAYKFAKELLKERDNHI